MLAASSWQQTERSSLLLLKGKGRSESPAMLIQDALLMVLDAARIPCTATSLPQVRTLHALSGHAPTCAREQQQVVLDSACIPCSATSLPQGRSLHWQSASCAHDEPVLVPTQACTPHRA